MLQQTRVDQVIPYYHRFLARFPDIETLARADIDDVFKVWEGLGYYSRARNLHKGAQDVIAEHGGDLPTSYESLLSITGIGPYTAAAISSIAFDQVYAAVDGNVNRVLARLFEYPEVISSTAAKKWTQHTANQLVSDKRPGAFNEAMMELGALVCTPRSPLCTQCPVAAHCLSNSANPELFPVRKPRKKVPHHHIAVGILRDKKGRILIQKRPENSMLGGLWEFPGGKKEMDESIEDACIREIKEETGIRVEAVRKITSIKHASSHFKITLHAFECNWDQTPDPQFTTDLIQTWVIKEALADYAFPRANRTLVENLQESGTEQPHVD